MVGVQNDWVRLLLYSFYKLFKTFVVWNITVLSCFYENTNFLALRELKRVDVMRGQSCLLPKI